MISQRDGFAHCVHLQPYLDRLGSRRLRTFDLDRHYSQQPHRGRKATFEFGGRAIQDWSGYSIFKWVGNQYRPEGTWEQWPGDYYGAGQHDGAQDEGHFYMECSNRGICDRKSGECECFDGYTGVGCSRLSCPESCSGHGTCETVDELRQQNPAWQQFSVETYKDSKTVYAEIKVDSTDGTNVVLLQPNDYIKIGHHPPMKIKLLPGPRSLCTRNSQKLYLTERMLGKFSSMTCGTPNRTGPASATHCGPGMIARFENAHLAMTL